MFPLAELMFNPTGVAENVPPLTKSMSRLGAAINAVLQTKAGYEKSPLKFPVSFTSSI